MQFISKAHLDQTFRLEAALWEKALEALDENQPPSKELQPDCQAYALLFAVSAVSMWIGTNPTIGSKEIIDYTQYLRTTIVKEK